MNLDRLVVLLKSLEGWRDYVYDDKSRWPRTEVGREDCYRSGSQYKVHRTGGTATIGYGETSADVIDRYWGRRITQDEALTIMRPRAQYFADGVRNCIRVSLTAHQLEACACRAYQAGVTGFCRSEVAMLLNDGDFSGALEAWPRVFAHRERSDAEIAHFLAADDEEEGELFKPFEGGTVHVSAGHNGRLWDLPGLGKQGDPLVIYKSDGGDDQRWHINRHPDGSVTFLTKRGTLALDIPNGDARQDINLRVWGINWSDAQRFYIVERENSECWIEPKLNRNMRVNTEAAGSDGAHVHLWSHTGGLEEVWRLIPAI